MPTIHDFGAFSVKIYYADHNPPHFHVVAPDYMAKVTIEDLSVMAGALPPGILRRVRDWAEDNQDLLREKWREYNGG